MVVAYVLAGLVIAQITLLKIKASLKVQKAFYVLASAAFIAVACVWLKKIKLNLYSYTKFS